MTQWMGLYISDYWQGAILGVMMTLTPSILFVAWLLWCEPPEEDRDDD